MKTFEEFAKDIVPDILTRYEFYKLCQMDQKGVIDMKVISIVAGFGSMKGTIMTIDNVYVPGWSKKIELWVKLTDIQRWTTYLCSLDELPHSVIPYYK